MEFLYHIAKQADWDAVQTTGLPYTVSTLGKSLDEVGFIHSSFARQVPLVANHIYRGQSDLVLLTIDPTRLTSPVTVEPVAGSNEQFPHIYGALNPDAVVAQTVFVPGPDGIFAFSE